MTESRLALFWSYAHADDKSDQGRIVSLAEDVRTEFATVTGVEVDLFVDRKSIEWGDDWRARIDDSLGASSFLIPVLTPRYFQRPECRREFTDFHGQAESRGYGKLILPLLYLEVEDFETGSKDEVVALAARSQYYNWSPYRLADTTSERYRTAVNEIVLQLRSRWREMQDVESTLLVESIKSEDPEPLGFADALAQVELRLPRWRELVEDDPVLVVQHKAVSDAYVVRIARAKPQQRLSIEHRQVFDLLPIARRDLELAQAYSAATIELNTYVLAVLRGAGQVSDFLPSLENLRDAVLEAKRVVETGTRLLPGEEWSTDYWLSMAHLGAKFRELSELFTASDRFKKEGNELLAGWISALAELGLIDKHELPQGGPRHLFG